MEKILYRAKRKDNGEWVYGYYAKAVDYLTDEYVHVIIPSDTTLYSCNEFSEYHEIIPETVGRLLQHCCYDSYCENDQLFQNDVIAVWHRRADVERTEPDAICLALDESSMTHKGMGRCFPQDTTRIRVIGNAYDNPDLLHGQDINHFINGLIDYAGTWETYLEIHRYLSDKYNIHGAHTCCYMCNFENDYICHQWNGGCDRIDVCRGIREKEAKED